MIKAADLPRELVDAFIDAMEAWGEVETQIFQTWLCLSGSPTVDSAWATFSFWGTIRQQKETLSLVQQLIAETEHEIVMPAVWQDLDTLTGTRNRIVHGYWHPIHLGSSADVIYIRQYDARGFGARPKDNVEEQAMLGQSRFYGADLRQAEESFRAAARSLAIAKMNMIGPSMASRRRKG